MSTIKLVKEFVFSSLNLLFIPETKISITTSCIWRRKKIIRVTYLRFGIIPVHILPHRFRNFQNNFRNIFLGVFRQENFTHGRLLTTVLVVAILAIPLTDNRKMWWRS